MKNPVFKPLILFLVFVFFISALIIYFKKINLPAFNFSKKSKGDVSFSDENLEKKGNKIVLKFSDIDIFIKSCCKTLVSDVKTGKNGDYIKMSGKASFPFSADFTGDAVPTIENEKLKINISNLILGKVEMPEKLKNELEKQIQKELNNKINGKYKIKDVRITSEGIEIEIK